MNTVEALIQTPFTTLSLEDKLRIKEMGPHTPRLNIQVEARDRGRTYTRRFSEVWYRRKAWLCGSIPKDALFCFPCLLFGGENLWTRIGMRDLLHLTQKLSRHEASKKHIDNVMKLCVLGSVNIVSQLDEGYRASVRQHNQEVDNNRYILSRIIDCIRYCGTFELALRGHDETEDSDNPGMFRGLIDLLSDIDAAVQVHLQQATVFRGLSKTIQNELLDCMLIVARNHIKEELKSAPFAAVESDDTTDVASISQNALIFRYVLEDGSPVERFYGFTKLKDGRAETIANVLLQQLEELFPGDKDKEKLIAQSYDGANVMRGERGGVQHRIKVVYKNAHYVHCYAHQLNLIIENSVSHVSGAKVFFGDLSGFPTFFSRSTVRTEALDQVVQRRLPRPVPTRWNFNIRTVALVYEKRTEILECLEVLKRSTDDAKGGTQRRGLKKHLKSKKFLFWLALFNKILKHTDILFHQLQRRQSDPVEGKIAIGEFQSSIKAVSRSIGTLFEQLPQESDSGTLSRRTTKESLENQALEVCNTIIADSQQRFAFTQHLASARLLDPTSFHTHSQRFPEDTLEEVTEAYPMLDKGRLRSELEALYEREELRSAKGAREILQILVNNHAEEALEQLVLLLKIVITTPLSTAEAERTFSALKRVKTYLRNTMGEERLNALTMLSVERKMIRNMPQFNTKVIEVFAAQKERRAKFMYKK